MNRVAASVNTSLVKQHKLRLLQLARRILRRAHQSVSLKIALHMKHQSRLRLYQLRLFDTAASCFWQLHLQINKLYREPDDAARPTATNIWCRISNHITHLSCNINQWWLLVGSARPTESCLPVLTKQISTDCHSKHCTKQAKITICHCNATIHMNHSGAR